MIVRKPHSLLALAVVACVAGSACGGDSDAGSDLDVKRIATRVLHGEHAAPPPTGTSSGIGHEWTRLPALELGELDTSLLLQSGLADSAAATIAAGWAGGSIRAFRRGPSGGCDPPCRERVALQIGWTWRSPGAATAFADAIPGWFRRSLDAQPQGTGAWQLDGGAAAFSTHDQRTRLAFAPTAGLARALAGD
jgi:hypothetical protein